MSMSIATDWSEDEGKTKFTVTIDKSVFAPVPRSVESRYGTSAKPAWQASQDELALRISILVTKYFLTKGYTEE